MLKFIAKTFWQTFIILTFFLPSIHSEKKVANIELLIAETAKYKIDQEYTDFARSILSSPKVQEHFCNKKEYSVVVVTFTITSLLEEIIKNRSKLYLLLLMKNGFFPISVYKKSNNSYIIFVIDDFLQEITQENKKRIIKAALAHECGHILFGDTIFELDKPKDRQKWVDHGSGQKDSVWPMRIIGKKPTADEIEKRLQRHNFFNSQLDTMSDHHFMEVRADRFAAWFLESSKDMIDFLIEFKKSNAAMGLVELSGDKNNHPCSDYRISLLKNYKIPR